MPRYKWYDEDPLSVIDVVPGTQQIAVHGDEWYKYAEIDYDEDGNDVGSEADNDRGLFAFYEAFYDSGISHITCGGKNYTIRMKDGKWRPIVEEEGDGNLADLLPAYRASDEFNQKGETV